MFYCVNWLYANFEFLKGGPTGATEANIDDFMETLQGLVGDQKNSAVLKQARDILNRTELPINWHIFNS